MKEIRNHRRGLIRRITHSDLHFKEVFSSNRVEERYRRDAGRADLKTDGPLRFT